MFKSINSLAADYKVHPCTIKRWVRNGVFPKPIKISYGTVRWRQRDIDAWEISKEVSAK
jgi:prophage regulatory protein